MTENTACPEADARDRRVAALADILGSKTREMCAAFDQSVEFAACEGKPLSLAIQEFFADDWDALFTPSALAQLKHLAVPSVPFKPSRLPVLPVSAARLLGTSDNATSILELEEIAGSDPVLAARALSAANSALYGSRSQICRLRDALLRLGVPASRRVLLAAGFSGLFASLRLQEMWAHSQTVADRAFQLADLCGADSATAYVAGLLHDIGRVAFTVFPGFMQAAETRWREAGFPLGYAETMAYGTDHATFGAELLRSWHLPEDLVNAVARHHRPEVSDSRLECALHLAESGEEDLWAGMRQEAALERTAIARHGLDVILSKLTEQQTVRAF